MEEKRESITKSELIEKISAKIPQLGSKHSLNISVSAGIVIWDLFQKIK